MTEKIPLVDHIINCVKTHQVSACQKYSWITGDGYLYCMGDEGWKVTFRKEGFLRKKCVYVRRYSEERMSNVAIPITVAQSKALWDCQELFAEINTRRSNEFNREQNIIKEKLSWWP